MYRHSVISDKCFGLHFWAIVCNTQDCFRTSGRHFYASVFQFLLTFLQLNSRPGFVPHFLKLGIPGGILKLLWLCDLPLLSGPHFKLEFGGKLCRHLIW